MPDWIRYELHTIAGWVACYLYLKFTGQIQPRFRYKFKCDKPGCNFTIKANHEPEIFQVILDGHKADHEKENA